MQSHQREQLTSGFAITGFITGTGHMLQEHYIVLVREKVKDLGLKYYMV